jgi:hypothetical protein
MPIQPERNTMPVHGTRPERPLDGRPGNVRRHFNLILRDLISRANYLAGDRLAEFGRINRDIGLDFA